MLSQWRTLAWGDGDGARLWSPGQPLGLFADGVRVGWHTADGLFAALGKDRVGFLSLPEPEHLSVGPQTWSAVVMVDGSPLLLWGTPGEPWQARGLPAGRTVSGGAWVRWRRGSRFAITTLAGDPVAAPMGASRAIPWPDGPGASWWEGRFLYRMTTPGKPRLAAILPGSITDAVIGPQGAAVVSVAEELYAVAPGGLPIPLELEAGLDEARLSATGALLLTHDGVGHFSLEDGSLIDEVGGDVVPAGFAPEPLILDEAQGTLCTLSGEVRAAHFLSGAPLLRGKTLYGPGGGVWDLIHGDCLYRSAMMSAEQLLPLGRGVLCVHARELVVLDGHGTELRRFARPSPGSVVIEGEQLLFLEHSRTLIADLSGKVLGSTTPRADSLPPPEPASRWGLRADGEVEMGGRLWRWSADGLLASFPA